MTRLRTLAAALVAALPLAAGAQGTTPEQRLANRLDAAIRGQVLALVDTARSHGLPVEPLILRALEGVTKGAQGPRIVQGVKSYLDDLERAQMALGRSSSPAELTAGAEALRAGMRMQDLQRTRSVRNNQRVAPAVMVIASLIHTGVPSDSAVGLIATLSRSGATDDHLVAFGENVNKDVVAGAKGLDAATARALEMERVVALTPGNGGGAPSNVPSAGRMNGQTPNTSAGPGTTRANVGDPSTPPTPPNPRPAPKGKPKNRMP